MKLALKLRVKITLDSVAYALWRGKYIVFVGITTYFIASFVVWSLNFGLVQYILFQAPKMTLLDKINFFNDGTKGVFTTFNNPQTIGIQIFSILFAINLAMLVFIFRRHGLRNVPTKSGGVALVFALLSSGCVACGTSIIAPLLITLGVTSAPLVHDLSTVFSTIGSILLIYSIHKLSIVVSTIKASEALIVV